MATLATLSCEPIPGASAVTSRIIRAHVPLPRNAPVAIAGIEDKFRIFSGATELMTDVRPVFRSENTTTDEATSIQVSARIGPSSTGPFTLQDGTFLPPTKPACIATATDAQMFADGIRLNLDSDEGNTFVDLLPGAQGGADLCHVVAEWETAMELPIGGGMHAWVRRWAEGVVEIFVMIENYDSLAPAPTIRFNTASITLPTGWTASMGFAQPVFNVVGNTVHLTQVQDTLPSAHIMQWRFVAYAAGQVDNGQDLANARGLGAGIADEANRFNPQRMSWQNPDSTSAFAPNGPLPVYDTLVNMQAAASNTLAAFNASYTAGTPIAGGSIGPLGWAWSEGGGGGATGGGGLGFYPSYDLIRAGSPDALNAARALRYSESARQVLTVWSGGNPLSLGVPGQPAPATLPAALQLDINNNDAISIGYEMYSTIGAVTAPGFITAEPWGFQTQVAKDPNLGPAWENTLVNSSSEEAHDEQHILRYAAKYMPLILLDADPIALLEARAVADAIRLSLWEGNGSGFEGTLGVWHQFCTVTAPGFGVGRGNPSGQRDYAEMCWMLAQAHRLSENATRERWNRWLDRSVEIFDTCRTPAGHYRTDNGLESDKIPDELNIQSAQGTYPGNVSTTVTQYWYQCLFVQAREAAILVRSGDTSPILELDKDQDVLRAFWDPASNQSWTRFSIAFGTPYTGFPTWNPPTVVPTGWYTDIDQVPDENKAWTNFTVQASVDSFYCGATWAPALWRALQVGGAAGVELYGNVAHLALDWTNSPGAVPGDVINSIKAKQSAGFLGMYAGTLALWEIYSATLDAAGAAYTP